MNPYLFGLEEGQALDIGRGCTATLHGEGMSGWEWEIVTPTGTFTGADLHSPRMGTQGSDCFEVSGNMRALLSFLSAALDSLAYEQRTGRPGDCADLFDRDLLDALDSAGFDPDEIAMLAEEPESGAYTAWLDGGAL